MPTIILLDAKTNLERARFKQREIITHNQKLRADNQALQKELDDLKTKGVPGSTPSNRKVEDLLEELKDSNKFVLIFIWLNCTKIHWVKMTSKVIDITIQELNQLLFFKLCEKVDGNRNSGQF